MSVSGNLVDDRWKCAEWTTTCLADSPYCDSCDEFLVDAWLRMTTAGVTARYGRSPSYRVLIAEIDGRIKWVPLAPH
jgi:hypothetical protein